MKILPITNNEELQDVAEVILEDALHDSETLMLFEQLVADPKADRRTLLATAFATGAARAVAEMAQGCLVTLDPGTARTHSDS